MLCHSAANLSWHETPVARLLPTAPIMKGVQQFDKFEPTLLPTVPMRSVGGAQYGAKLSQVDGANCTKNSLGPDITQIRHH